MIDTIHPRTFWVVGQKVSVVSVSENYSVVDTIASAAVPGPPLHLHKNNSEQFFVLEGTLEIVTSSQRIRLSAGESVIVPANTAHTFENPTDSDVRMISIYSPPGFEQYFSDMGVPANVPNARESSSDPKIIERIRSEASQYGMCFPSVVDEDK